MSGRQTEFSFGLRGLDPTDANPSVASSEETTNRVPKPAKRVFLNEPIPLPFDNQAATPDEIMDSPSSPKRPAIYSVNSFSSNGLGNKQSSNANTHRGEFNASFKPLPQYSPGVIPGPSPTRSFLFTPPAKSPFSGSTSLGQFSSNMLKQQPPQTGSPEGILAETKNWIGAEAMTGLSEQMSQMKLELQEQMDQKLDHLNKQFKELEENIQRLVERALASSSLSRVEGMQLGSNGSQGGANGVQPRESGIQKQQRRASGVICTTPGYYVKPSLEELDGLVDDDGKCIVNEFEVGRQGFGKIRFLTPVNVANINIDKIVQFSYREVFVYPSGTTKPSIGQGLNVPAEIQLRGEWVNAVKVGELPLAPFSRQFYYRGHPAYDCNGKNGVYVAHSSEGPIGVLTFRVSDFGSTADSNENEILAGWR